MGDEQTNLQIPVKTAGDNILNFMQEFMKIPIDPQEPKDDSFSENPFETAEELSNEIEDNPFLESSDSKENTPFSSQDETSSDSFEDYLGANGNEEEKSSSGNVLKDFPWLEEDDEEDSSDSNEEDDSDFVSEDQDEASPVSKGNALSSSQNTELSPYEENDTQLFGTENDNDTEETVDDLEEILSHLEAISQHFQGLSSSLRHFIDTLKKRT